MDSEQTIESIIRRISSDDNVEMAARFHERIDGLKARLDALESAMSKPHTVLAHATRTPPSFELPDDVATPAPAAEQQWTHRLRKDDGRRFRLSYRNDMGNETWQCDDGCGPYIRTEGGRISRTVEADADMVPLDPPAQPAPPPADVVLREDVLTIMRTVEDHKGMIRAIEQLPSASSPAPDVRAEAMEECKQIILDMVHDAVLDDRQGQTIISVLDERATAPAGAGGEGGGK